MKRIVFRAVIAVVLCFFSACSREANHRPNVVFILADDFGYYDMSCTGSKVYETPNLDRIAAQSMQFTSAYANCQVCSPSRASILTGRFPARHGITDYIGARSGEEWRKQLRFNKLLPAPYKHQLDCSLISLPEALKAEGYNTFFAGKWHLGPQGSWPEDHGFDVNIGGWDAGSPKGGYFSPYMNPNLKDGAAGENLSQRLGREAARYIRENNPNRTGDPFFVYLSFYAVHGPIQTTQAKWRKYRDKIADMGISEQGFEMAKYLPIRQQQDNPIYAGLVEQMDEGVGIVLDVLKELDLDKNTIVIFTSDNGGVASGDDFSTSNRPLRAGKGYQFEGGIREPYFIQVPWMHHHGRACDVPVIGSDFYPTILDLVGADLRPEEHLDGISLLPLLKGESIEERPLIWHYPHYGNQGGEPSSIIRRGDWKLIHYYEDGRDELYNLREDNSELTDLTDQYPDIVQRLSTELFAYLNAVEAKYPIPDPDYDSEAEAKYLDNVRTNRMLTLEKQRLKYLSDDFNPDNHWWGSEVED